MSKSKCCNEDIWGYGGFQSERYYICSKCKERVTPVKGSPPPPASKIKPKYNLNDWFKNQPENFIYDKPIGENFNTDKLTKVIQLNGMEIVLFEDGTYNLSDTTGG